MISFPVIAYKTYQKFKDTRAYRRICEYVEKKLSKLSRASARAKFVHRQVDKNLKQVLEDELVQQHIKCQNGCSACCYTQVSVTQDEAILLAELVESGIKIDMQKLFRQKEAGNSATHWYQLKYEDRACVFLNEKNECSIYENRPSVCRTNFVISNPTLCDTSDGLEKPIQLINTFSSDMVIYAAFKYSTQAGTLPSLLWQALEIQKDVLFQPDDNMHCLDNKNL